MKKSIFNEDFSNLNRESIRQFKKINKLNHLSNKEVKDMIFAYQVKEKNEMLKNLNEMLISSNDFELDEDAIE